MNKKTKGLISGIVGAGLLLGAGGTFAIWNDRATIDDDGLITGNLAIDDVELDTWIRTASWSEQALDVEVDALVPGDIAEAHITNTFLTLVGDSIRAELTIDGLEDIAEDIPLVVSIRGFGGTDGGFSFQLAPVSDISADHNFVAVFSAAEVLAFNTAVLDGVYPTLSIEFPLVQPNEDGTPGVFSATDDSNWWGQANEDDDIVNVGTLTEIVLRDTVQLVFVQTNAESTLEGLGIDSDWWLSNE